MPDFGIFRGFNQKLFGDKLYAGQLPTQLGLIGSEDVTPFLLDRYQNAAAAYSLRLLRTAYTGSAIRVRRASDNTEQDIGFVDGELNTSTLTSFCSGTDGFVKTWYDQSGNAYDASQTTAANQPQIVSSGSTITQNGKPTIDAKNSGFLVASSFSISELDIFISYQKGTGTSNTGIVGSWIPSNNWAVLSAYFLNPNDFGMINYDNSSVRTDFQSGDILSVGSNYLINSVFYDKMYYYKNGNLINSSTSISNTRFVSDLAIFTYTNALQVDPNSKIQELILYPSNQSANRTGISDNINSYYNIY